MRTGDLTSIPSTAIRVKAFWSYTQAIYTSGLAHMVEVTRYSCPSSSDLYTTRDHGTTDQLEILLACYGESPMRPDVSWHLGFQAHAFSCSRCCLRFQPFVPLHVHVSVPKEVEIPGSRRSDLQQWA